VVRNRLVLLLLALVALNLVGWFSTPIADTDFWWHLRTGQRIVETHSLPVPDVFSYTLARAKEAYAGESSLWHFNLTHEWLAQAIMWLVYSVGGIPFLIFVRALILAATAALAGLLAWKRSSSVAWGITGSLLAGGTLLLFAADRPSILSFFFVAAVLCIFELGLPLWILPIAAVVWANLHGGFFLGWIICVIYVAAAWRAKAANVRALALWGGAFIVASGLNPNFFGVVSTLVRYRSSPMTATLIEWQPLTLLGPPYLFQALFAVTLVLLVWARGKGRLSDWALAAAFGAAGWMAFRNSPLFGIVAPMMLATYVPRWRRPRWLGAVAAVALVAALGYGISSGRACRWSVDASRTASESASFVAGHHLPGPILNTYGDGGYLIWRLWPEYRVFIDGRSLSENIFMDYRILFGALGPAGELDRQRKLDEWGIQTIVLEAFQPDGTIFPLAVWLTSEKQKDWKMVHADTRAMVFCRANTPGLAALTRAEIDSHIEAECAAMINSTDPVPECARAVGYYFGDRNDQARARHWLFEYVSRVPNPDPAVQRSLAGR